MSHIFRESKVASEDAKKSAAAVSGDGEQAEFEPGFCQKYKWPLILLLSSVWIARAVFNLPSREMLLEQMKTSYDGAIPPEIDLNQVADSGRVFALVMSIIFLFVVSLLILRRCCKYEKKKRYNGLSPEKEIFLSKAIVLSLVYLGICSALIDAFKISGAIFIVAQIAVLSGAIVLAFKTGTPEKAWHRWVPIAIVFLLTANFYSASILEVVTKK